MCRRSEQWTGSGHSPRELPHAHVCPLPLHQSAELRLGPGLPSGNEGHEVSQSPKASISSPVLLWSTLVEAAKNGPRKTLSGIFFYDFWLDRCLLRFLNSHSEDLSIVPALLVSDSPSFSQILFVGFCFFVCWFQTHWVKSMCVSLFVGVKFSE